MADVKYIISADAKGAVTEIKKVEGAVEGMKTQAKQAKPALGGMIGKLAAGAAVFLVAKAAIRGMVGWMKSAVSAAIEQEDAEKALVVALQSTGREVPVLSDHFKNYAAELQKATTFGDEEILNAQALLIQLTKLDRDGLDRATKGALGLATVFKTDLKSATALVAKALAGNYGALSRYGISVTHLNTDEEKRASLLEQLEVLYKRAEGETETYGGKISQLANAYSDLKEEAGKAITENEAILDLLDDIKEKLVDLVESGAIETAVSGVTLYFSALFEVLAAAKEGFDAVTGSTDNFREKFGLLGKITQFNTFSVIARGVKEYIYGIDDAEESTDDFTIAYDKLTDAGKRLHDQLEALKKKAKEASGKEGIGGFNNELENTRTIIVETVIPALNNMAGVAYNTQEKLKSYIFNANDLIEEDTEETAGNIEDEWEETIEEINKYWDSLTTNIGRSYGALFWELTDKNSTFEESFDLFGQNLINSFRATIEEMISDWTTGFIQGLIDGSKDAGEAVRTNLASAVGGEDSTSVAGAFDNVGGAASALLPTITAISSVVSALANVAQLFSKPKGFSEHMWYLRETQENTQELRDYMFLVQRHWITVDIPERISKGLAKQDITNRLLRDIRSNTGGGLGESFGGETTPGAGTSGMPTIKITGRVKPLPLTITVPVYLDSRQIMLALANRSVEMSRDGQIKWHNRGIVGG